MRHLLYYGLAFFFVIASIVSKKIVDSGTFQVIIPHNHLLECKTLRLLENGRNLMVASEDIAVDAETGIAIISSDPERHHLFSTNNVSSLLTGFFSSLDLGSDSPRPKMMKIVKGDLGFPLHPHGIGLIREEGSLFLFAANHRSLESDSIEIFKVSLEKNEL